ncbi:hypothetical protein DRO91_04330 [Candidatus Heimdallarchaeota archaeon]|nr:MAG: hypothetical protein DRO91_04330 [Candidatus Heimdallarchaeota archaeon]
MQWDNIKSIVLKEYWTYVGSRKIISILFIMALYAVVIGINYIIGPEALTSYSRELAMKQISSSASAFGINPSDVEKMGDNAILLAAMVIQLPLTIAVFSYFATYNSILTSFLRERMLGTMEVLFSCPLDEREIIGGKILASATVGMTTWAFLFLMNTTGIETITMRSLGRVWIPIPEYIILSVLYPLSMIFLAIPVGLLISAGMGKWFGEQVGGLVGIIPLLFVAVLPRINVMDFFELVKVLVGASILTIFVLLKFLKIKRLSFITN